MRINAQVIVNDLPVTPGASALWEAIDEEIELRMPGSRTASDWDQRFLSRDGEVELGDEPAERWAARVTAAVYEVAPAVRIEVSTRRTSVKIFHRFDAAEARQVAARPFARSGR